jgi:hypothetical protein
VIEVTNPQHAVYFAGIHMSDELIAKLDDYRLAIVMTFRNIDGRNTLCLALAGERKAH